MNYLGKTYAEQKLEDENRRISYELARELKALGRALIWAVLITIFFLILSRFTLDYSDKPQPNTSEHFIL